VFLSGAKPVNTSAHRIAASPHRKIADEGKAEINHTNFLLLSFGLGDRLTDFILKVPSGMKLLLAKNVYCPVTTR
jgi:hypothetical protein